MKITHGSSFSGLVALVPEILKSATAFTRLPRPNPFFNLKIPRFDSRGRNTSSEIEMKEKMLKELYIDE